MIAVLLLCHALCLALADDENQQETDAFMRGYVTSAIERELELSPKEFVVTATNGEVTVWLDHPSAELIAKVEELLATLKGITRAQVLERKEGQPELPALEVQPTEPIETERETLLPPSRYLFLPLLADPKEPSFFVSYRKYDFEERSDVDIAAIGIGGAIPLWRSDPDASDLWQLAIEAGVFSEFNLDESSNLLNSDYIVGFPLHWRHRNASARFRIYHQSSHLGDETLAAGTRNRFDLSYESLELLLAYEAFGLRGYGGGEYFVRRSPDELDDQVVHWGLEGRTPHKLFDSFRLAGGIDVKHYEEFDYAPDRSVKAGLVFGDVTNEIHVMAEYFNGHSPHGQFLLEDVDFYGIAVSYRF